MNNASQRAVTMLVLTALATATLVIYMSAGLSCRFQADDFAYYSYAQTAGVFHAVRYFYQAGGSGRYTFTFLAGSLSLINPAAIRVVPALALVAWLASLSWCVSRLLRAYQVPTPWRISFFCAEILVLATITTTPNLWQSLYWMDSFFNYTLPLLLFTTLMGVIVHAQPTHPPARTALILQLLAGTLALVAAGCNEMIGILQCYLLAGATACCIRRHRSDMRTALVLTATVASLIGLALVALAPGTRARASQYSHPTMLSTIGYSIHDGLELLWNSLTQPPYTVSAALLIAFLLGTAQAATGPSGAQRRASPRAASVWLWRLPPFVVGGAILCFVLPIYGLNAYPPHRVIIVPLFVLICGLAGWCFLLGIALPASMRRLRPSSRVLIRATIGCLLLLIVTRTIGEAFRYQSVAHRWATLWDRRDATLRTAARRNQLRVVLPAMPNMGDAGEPFYDPTSWNNRIVATYYGLTSFTATGLSYAWEGTW